MVKNITERKQAEAALGESEEQWRRLFEQSSDAIFIHTLDGNILDVNSQTCEMLGYTRDQLLSMAISALHPEDALSGSREAIQTVREEGAVRFESRFKKANGQIIDVEISSSVIDYEKGIVQGIARDTSERKQAEEALRESIRSMEIAYGQARIYAQELTEEIAERKRAEEEIRKLNEALEQRVADRTRELSVLYEVTMAASESLDLETMLERSLERVLKAVKSSRGHIHLLNEADEISGGETLRLAVQQDLPANAAIQIDSIPLGSDLADWVIKHNRLVVVTDLSADPRTTQVVHESDLAYIGVPMRARGRVLGVLSVLRKQQFNAEEMALLASVADQVGVAVENARLRQQAEQAAVMEERARLARELHDSVTQSLYSLTLFAEWGCGLFEAGELEAAKQRLIRMGETARQALKEMRLLVYELRPAALEQDGLVGALQRRLDAVENRSGIEVTLLVEPLVELPAPLEEGLYRIAQEALNNALKHAAASLVTVRIYTDDQGVTLEIEDDGTGFDPNEVSDKGGLGLASIQERVAQLGGVLAVVSAPGKGTKVKITVEVT